MLNAATLSAEPDECAKEPIQIPGSIQPHGYLFVLNAADLTVVAASANAADTMRIKPQDLIGRPITDLLVTVPKASLEAALNTEKARTPLRVRFRQPAHGEERDCIIRPAEQGLVFLELAPGIAAGQTEALLAGIGHATERIRKAESPQGACDALAREIRQLTGFDRVMIYRFDADWNGEVIAEDRAAGARAYLGHAFPAADIPAQARALYLRNTVRLIPDACYTPSPMIPPVLPATGQPIDLSAAFLRSVSPVHLAYMANMAVAASMSISIVRDGRLWGLAACHHLTPRLLPNPVLQACELLVQAAVWYLDANDRSTAAECFETVRRVEAELATIAGPEADYRVRLQSIASCLLDLTRAQGLGICDGETIWTTGTVPPNEMILGLAEWLQDADQETLTTSRLSGLFPPAEAWQAVASGVAARRLPSGWLFCFRAEWPHTMTWAGDITKRAEPGSDRLNPRKSFAAWRQAIGGESRPWTPPDLAAVDGVQSLVLRAIMVDQMRRLAERELALKAYHDRTVEEMGAASRMQYGLLPAARLRAEISAKSGLDIAGRLASCSELGGDLWGLRDLEDGRVGVYVVDFAGHGTTAALNTFRLHSLIPEFRALLLDPAGFLNALNLRLVELLSTGDYATMFYGVVDPNANRLTYAAAGSPPPIVRCSSENPLRILNSRGLPLGISTRADYASLTADFDSGAMLLLYSDVLTDAVDEHGKRAEETGAFALVQSCAGAATAEAVVEAICAPFLDRPATPLSDDLTVVCIRRP